MCDCCGTFWSPNPTAHRPSTCCGGCTVTSPGGCRPGPAAPPPVSLAFLEAVLSHVGLSEVHKAIALFLDAPPAMGGPQHTQRSIYREILFLTLAALGREHTDIAAFDKKYRSAFSKLAGSLGKEELRRRRAQPPSSKAIDCRKSFGALLEC
ncbi:DENN domain-containing protein 4B [Gallus gallus]|uniref:DENN domain-containing protein 4B n=1 Tax=Gallus gallus TaxID=9031 RepID=UPI001AE92CB1|nr:DENN domain-containing protein 4B [Gallus gallus]